MTTVKVRLDDLVLQRAHEVAKERGNSLDELVAYALDQLYLEQREDDTLFEEQPLDSDVADQRKALQRLLAISHPPAPVLSAEAMSRESIYDR